MDMSSTPPPSGSKKGFRGSLSRFYNRIKSPSPKPASRELHGSSTSGARPASPLPHSESTPTGNTNSHLSAPGHTTTQQAAASSPDIAQRAFASSTPLIVRTSVDQLPSDTADGGPNTEQGDRIRRFDGLRSVLTNLHRAAGVFPPLQLLTGSLVSSVELFQTAADNRRDGEQLASDLQRITTALEKHLQGPESEEMSDCITNIVQNLKKEMKELNDINQQQGVYRLEMAGANAEKLVGCYRRVTSAFWLLQVDASMSTQKLLINTRLEAMSPAKAAKYDSAVPKQVARSKCTETTRIDVLSGMNSWSSLLSDDPKAAKVYWLDGMAGTGKTTIAYSLSAALAERNQLGASFFCTRQLKECRNANQIIPTIAYQLAWHSRVFQHALCKILDTDPNLATQDIQTQFEKLLESPLREVQVAMSKKVVIVIDALDECDDQELVGTLLNLLFQRTVDLPLKFFVTARPETEVPSIILPNGNSVCTVLHLHDLPEESVRADIRAYLKEELESLSPTDDELERLVELSNTLFIYAATTVRYIKSKNKLANPQKRLRAVLDSKPESNRLYSDLDALYVTILKRVLEDNDLEKSEADCVRLVLEVFVCVLEPVAVKTLSVLAGVDEKVTEAIVQSLRSVLHIREGSGLVSTFHASFPDFLFDKTRPAEFFCDKQSYALHLTDKCFQVMKADLKFNICDLESSFMLDEEINDLGQRVNSHISGVLSYACRYWGDHLSRVAPVKDLCALLEDLLSRQLLFWMEVLNLTKANPQGISMLQKIQTWLSDSTFSPHSPLVSQVETFVTAFSANPISLSTPHIYVSAIPLFHKSIPALAGYWEHMNGLMIMEGTAMEQMGSTSPTSREARNGDECIINPPKGHTNSVNSVAFSLDSTRIVSGSGDCTICVWDAQDGKLVSGPFKGHTDWVRSVAFSPDPDGTRVVSGSDDCSVCVWTVQYGTLAVDAFKGHTKSVNSVGFSPDGMHVVSGSSDCTICVWNSQNGELSISPLKGHTKSVNSVAFSQDGTRIVSGSADCTICVWGAQDGNLVVGPIEGHTDWVKSVAFSPDGMRIISGSDDCNICVWNARDGSLDIGPLTEHSNWVRSVAFSPDGTRIVSGSDDCTICIWNAHDGNLVSTSSNLKGHAHYITSVAFSPNSKHIVSGSGDGTILIWNVQDGSLITPSGPFEWQSSSVESELFSPCSMRGGEWELELSGWVVNQARERLFWVPPPVHPLPRPYHLCAIGPQGSLRINYNDILLGENWSRCYGGR